MSNELKVTGGDWYSKREGFSTVYVFSRIGGGLVQEVAACGPTNDGPDQQEANARLIAASKKLYEALEQTLLELESHQRSAYCSLDGCFDETLEAARSALAAARGETQ